MMAALANWLQYLRVREEVSYNASAPQTADEWNTPTNGIGGANGWIDVVDNLDNPGLQSNAPLIFPQSKVGGRGANTIAPVAGSREEGLGNIVMPVIPDMFVRWLTPIFTTNTITPTAGQAALSATAFASIGSLDTQPNSLEQLVFTIASSDAASGASIDIIQDSVVVETITIGTSGSSVDGVYYSKYAYNGSSDAITIADNGTVTNGTVAVAGIDYTSHNLKFASTAPPSIVIEQANRVEEGSGNSEFFPGCRIPTLNLAYDRATQDSILIATLAIQGLAPTVATSTTYAGDAKAGSVAAYKPIAGWTGAIQLDDSDNAEVVSANLNINSNDEIYSVSSGTQSPSAASEGPAEFTGQLTVIPTGTTRWDDYQAATARKFELEFLTPHYVNATTPYQFKITANELYIENYERTIIGNLQGATLTVRGVVNSTDVGPCQVDIRARMPV